MAKTSDYMDYLDREIGIAPANSQEEFRAAETLVEIMKDHDLEPTIQEFDSHPTGALLPNILAVVMFFGVLLSGIGPLPMRVMGFLLALVCAVLLIMRHMGRDVLSGVGPASRSQNVIAVHKATGDKVTKGSRPIVVVAHYDTPRESPLFERLAPYQARIAHASVIGIVVASAAVLLQIFVFLPGGLRLVLWIVGLIAMLPALLLAVSSFVEKASPCTAGANDNKASVAALLGLLDKVRPQDDRVSVTSGPEAEAYDSDDDQGHEEVVEEQTLGIRHGKEVLQELGILPETCEIVYEVPADDQEGILSGGTNVADPDATIEDQAEVPAKDAGEASFTGDDEPEYQEPEEEEGYAPDEPVDDGYAGVEPDDVDALPEGNDLPAEQQDDSYLYDDEGYMESPTEDSESWDYDETWEETESEQSYSQVKAKTGRSLSDGIRRAFASIRERLSGSGKDGDIAIPRGAGDDVDYSEFEETDWGDDDDWSNETPDSQEELRSISRDELIARRSTSRQTDEPEEPTYSTADDSAADDWQQSGEEPVEEDRTEPDVSEQISGELYEEQDDGDEAESAADEQPDGDAEPIVEARTSHDISHDNGPDWSVLEEEIVEEGQEVAPDPTLYRESERQSQSDDDLDLGATDLVEVEEELDEDQVASAPIRRHPATEPGREDGSVESQEAVPTSGRPDEGDSQRQDPDDGEDSELSWDDAESREGDDEDDVLPKDSRGLDTISDDYDAYAGSGDDDLEEPDPIDDPTWGKTSYVPPRPKDSVARRATLYDVPSPSEETVDPLDADGPDDSEDTSSSTGLEEDRREDTQDSDRNRSTDWKGGAAVRSDLLDGGDDYPADDAEWSGDGEYDSAEQPLDDSYAPEEPIVDEDAYGSDPANDSVSSGIDQGELQDAILKMGDDLLVSHDIWFVATGASSVDHAGIKAFLSDFRQDIRGAFLINLDSVGAGELTVITSEGLNEGRRADRRLVRLLSNVAEDLHLPLSKRSHDWSDTEATPAMRSRVRAATIMGVDQNGLPALSHTQDDVPENVDPAQVAAVVRVIAEAIRRS